MGRHIFALRDEDALDALPKWCRRRRYNSFISDLKDRFGNTLIGLSLEHSTPRGPRYEQMGLICVADRRLFADAEQIVKDNMT